VQLGKIGLAVPHEEPGRLQGAKTQLGDTRNGTGGVCSQRAKIPNHAKKCGRRKVGGESGLDAVHLSWQPSYWPIL
jgi:hypothetical protein